MGMVTEFHLKIMRRNTEKMKKSVTIKRTVIRHSIVIKIKEAVSTKKNDTDIVVIYFTELGNKLIVII